MMSNDTLLQLDELKVHFFTDEGLVKAVNGVSYSLKRGKTLCVVGESGSGKSVSARAILQLVQRPGKIVGGKINYFQEVAPEKYKKLDIASLDPRGREVSSHSW